MGRPEILTDEMKTYIAKLKLDNQKLTASELTRELKIYLVEKTSKHYSGRTRGEVEKLVEDEQISESAITKFLTSINHRLNIPSELDKPWSVTTLVKYPIPPEAVPLVILAWVHVLAEGIDVLSIREALWIGRLYKTVNTDNMDNEEIARWLSIVALEYSDTERLSEITDLPYLPDFYRDLELYEEITEQKMSSELEEKVKRLIEKTPEIEQFKAKYRAKYKGKKGGKTNERLNKATNA